MRTRSGPLGWLLGSTATRYQTVLTGSEYPPTPIFRLSQVSREAGNTSDPSSLDDDQAKIARLEAVLFISREPLSTRKLAKLARLADGTEARTLLKSLAKKYDERTSAIQVVEVAGGVQLLTRPAVADWLRRLHGEGEEMRLSPPALETLAVVAYRQPVVRAEVEAIRGVQCGEILKVLMERDLLRIVGRSEDLGRPFLYGTTKNFLRVFGLRRLEQLPAIDQIQGVGVAG
ncbi:SMC-Scp complex subunit ScpB [Bythopirellula goksoeyrii]|uniref:Segregation and condensation protein B n=1 Tax=Bythopirellula goksoeyrii TaxID=1400387 RepID=A0A5B9QKH8_9BACT|nr:SMC-Scp complex subunit ScpB [Bythopirellula goksoeyrii]QEG38045.1 Segregation and condensation protein B [Bythopirellula goksoeyrii]